MTVTGASRRHFLGAAWQLAAAGVTLAPSALASPTSAGTSLPQRHEWIIRGANVLTMDAKVPDLTSGDLHVRGGRIIAIGVGLVTPPDAEEIDAHGMICMPGFVDTHWHLWTSMFRPYARADRDDLGYFPVTSGMGRHMAPEDSLLSVRLGLMEALSSGVTTVHNWAHNTRSPAHAEGELKAMQESGIRGRFAYGPFHGMPDDQSMDFAAIETVRDRWQGRDGRLSVGICSRSLGAMGSGLAPRGALDIDQLGAEWTQARRLGLPVTMHTSGPSPVMELERAGLLGPDVQLVHPMLTKTEERQILQRRGVSYSISPMAEGRRARVNGVVQLGRCWKRG